MGLSPTRAAHPRGRRTPSLVNLDKGSPICHVCRLLAAAGKRPFDRRRGEGRGQWSTRGRIPHAFGQGTPRRIPARSGTSISIGASQGRDHAAWIRFYEFPERSNFFPPLTSSAPWPLGRDMAGKLGIVTPLYFKNPGFAKGDKLTIKVRDMKNLRAYRGM